MPSAKPKPSTKPVNAAKSATSTAAKTPLAGRAKSAGTTTKKATEATQGDTITAPVPAPERDFPATGERRAKLLRLKRRLMAGMRAFKALDADPDVREVRCHAVWDAMADAVVDVSNETQTKCPELC